MEFNLGFKGLKEGL